MREGDVRQQKTKKNYKDLWAKKKGASWDREKLHPSMHKHPSTQKNPFQTKKIQQNKKFIAQASIHAVDSTDKRNSQQKIKKLHTQTKKNYTQNYAHMRGREILRRLCFIPPPDERTRDERECWEERVEIGFFFWDRVRKLERRDLERELKDERMTPHTRGA